MFLLRLKTEFSENLKLVLALWIAMAVIAWSFYEWWFGPLARSNDSLDMITGFSVFGALIILIMLVGTMFKRDDLKHEQEFWATRPIRSHTLFGAKLVFAWLAIVIPCSVLMAALGWIAGVGLQAVWHGLEIMLWVGFIANLMALSAMAYAGGNKSWLALLAFFGGVIATSLVINSSLLADIARAYQVNGIQMKWNTMVVLFLLNGWLIWKCVRQVQNKHRSSRASFVLLTGMLATLLVAFAPFPGGLPGTNIRSSTVLPTVTKASLNMNNASYGSRNGAGFVSFGINLFPDEKILGNSFTLGDGHLGIINPNKDWPFIQISPGQLVVHFGPSGSPGEAKPSLEVIIMDRIPRSGGGGGSSSRVSPEFTEKQLAIPRKKLRVSGQLTLNRVTYRTLSNEILGQPFMLRDKEIRAGYLLADTLSYSEGGQVVWKRYAPPMLNSANLHNQWESVRYRIEQPQDAIRDLSHRIEGGGSSSGGFFGPQRTQVLRLRDADIGSDYEWNELKKSGYTKSAQEWKNETRLIMESVIKIEPLILPISIEVEIPDPNMVRKLIPRGGL